MRAGITTLYRYCIDNKLQTLLSEYSEDNPYPADKIGFKSTTVCKWVCSHGHIEYEAPITECAEATAKLAAMTVPVHSGKDIRSLQNTGHRKTKNQPLPSAPVLPFHITGAVNTGTNGNAPLHSSLPPHLPAPTARAKKTLCLPTDWSF